MIGRKTYLKMKGETKDELCGTGGELVGERIVWNEPLRRTMHKSNDTVRPCMKVSTLKLNVYVIVI